MNITEYIIEKTRESGCPHLFGIPGDFAIPFFAEMDEIGIEPIIMAHEPSLGYAADAYARINGLAVTFVTYGAGALNMINSIAQAYAENSPVIVISGAPELNIQKRDLLVHHKVKSFQSQLNIYKEITCIARQITDINSAKAIISEVFHKVKTESKPGYIEVPRELIRKELPEMLFNGLENKEQPATSNNKALLEIKAELSLRLSQAKSPIILAGSEVSRKKLQGELEQLINTYNIPCMTSMSGKSVIDETHPNCIGTYMGEMGEEVTFNALRESDMVLILGVRETDMDTGLFSAKVNKAAIVHAVDNELMIGYHKYSNISLDEVLQVLLSITPNPGWSPPNQYFKKNTPSDVKGQITTDKVICLINELVGEQDYRIILDVGDLMFNSVRIRAHNILSPSYYASMGFAIPASIAASLSDSSIRPLAFVGDGAFQMTGLELGVIKRYNLNPIIVLMNNNKYETMCVVDKDRKIYDTPKWNYCQLAEAAGINSFKADTMESLAAIIREASKKEDAVFIEATVSREIKSKMSKKLSQRMKQKQINY